MVDKRENGCIIKGREMILGCKILMCICAGSLGALGIFMPNSMERELMFVYFALAALIAESIDRDLKEKVR